MRRLAAALVIVTLPACADVPTDVARNVEDEAIGFTTTSMGPPCVFFTIDGTDIAGSLDCGDTAFGIDVSFGGGPATITLSGAGPLTTPRGITGFRVSFEGAGPSHGSITNLQWKQGSRVINQSVLPSGAAGATNFDVDVRTFTDVRWVGGGKINIPANANDLHYFLLLGNT